MRTNSRRRIAAAVLSITLAASLSLANASAAMADIHELDDDWLSSSTNPGKYDEYNVAWREGWGNSLLPQFTVKIPSVDPVTDPGVIYGAHYSITRLERWNPAFRILPSMWPTLYKSPVTESEWNIRFDMPAEAEHPGPYLGSNTAPANATRPYEGYYATNFQFFAYNEPAGAVQSAWWFGVDVTPPEKVTGLKMYDHHPSSGGLPLASGAVTTQSRIHLTWDDKQYDKLSGTGYFGVYLDGKPFVPTGDDDQRRVFDLQEHYSVQLASGETTTFGIKVITPRAVTIEEMPAGEHSIQLAAVDRATNAGPLSTALKIFVDPDIPDVDITWPGTNGSTIGMRPTFTADVKDKGGVAIVRFYVDGQLVGADSEAPYGVSADLSAFNGGSSHTLKVVAQDRAGQSNYQEKSFVLDKSAPQLSGLGYSSSPFFPNLRDGYKDNFVVKYTTSEAASATLTIKNSAGRTIRTISKFVSPGAKSVAWDGKNGKGEVVAGTYRWSLSLADSSRNSVATPYRPVSIRTYEIRITGNNKVQVIPR